MLKTVSILLCLSFFFPPAFSQPLELKPSVPKCQPELKLCSYTTQNITARTLISRITTVMFPNEPLDPREGFITRLTAKEITFWFHNEELLQRFNAIIAQMDVLEDFTPGPLIAFETEIFAITQEGLVTLNGSLGLSNIGANTPSNPSAGFSAAFGIGNFTLAVSLTAVVNRGQAHKVTTVRQILPNLAQLNFKHVSKVFISPTPGQVVEQEVGIKVGGELSLARQGDRRVLAHNYNLFYGVELRHPEDGARVNVLEFTTPDLVLDEGISHTLVSLNSFESSRMVGLGIPSSFNANNARAKLLVITRAQAISYEEFLEQNAQLRQHQLKVNFTQEEIDAFPNDQVALEDVLGKILPTTQLMFSGEQVLSLKLDRSLARKENIHNVVKVNISAPGFKQVAVRTMENLMLSGITLEKLPPKLMAKELVKFKISFRSFPKKKLFALKNTTLHYNPQTRQWFSK